MNSFYITINKNDQFLIVPDVEGHMDGHPVLTYIYSIFSEDKDEPFTGAGVRKKQNTLHLDKSINKNYFGYVKFDLPGKIFTYMPGDYNRLSAHEIEEVVQHISHYRDNPQQWGTRF